MNWTLDQLEAFVTSVKQGSFSAAARKLGKAQSRVSTSIANLEADLGIELFDRSSRLPTLTQAGKEMYGEAESILSQCQRLEARAFSVSAKQEVALTIAMDEAVPIGAFEQFFEQVADRFPLLKLTIINGSQEDIAQWVDEKKADLGILFHVSTLPESLEFASIGQFQHSLIVSKHHDLASTPEPTITQLSRYKQLVICDRMGHSKGQAICANHWFIDSYYYITALVMRNIGWALVPEHLARDDFHRQDIVELSTKHIPHSVLVEMGIVKRADRGEGEVSDWIYQGLVDRFNRQ
ncbi:LysR family transcriptional regulator [Vibrio sp. SCSIO 43136]|uniref:LysR family transcriptional regulator n=1 Tax=Vibrio sp. SCSIO 43136 TaxID=2819101 RepID=UPI00207605D6|nr:LysR family transcriptional regulator [Vibrio sp. SCSIO 43136]USD67102.1 LysR family transcriptional regulator [Vibrio sp. SCSIO 43136]